MLRVPLVAREILVTALRSFFEEHGSDFSAKWSGKYKMVLQCAALIAVFVSLEPRGIELTPFAEYTILIRNGLIYLMLFTTALSGLQYLWRAWRLYRIND